MNLNTNKVMSSSAQLSYTITSVVTLLLIIPAIVLNLVVIVKYFNLSPVERRQNSKLLILNQAITDVFNVAINSPLNAIVNMVYYTNIIDHDNIAVRNIFQFSISTF